MTLHDPGWPEEVWYPKGGTVTLTVSIVWGFSLQAMLPRLSLHFQSTQTRENGWVQKVEVVRILDACMAYDSWVPAGSFWLTLGRRIVFWIRGMRLTCERYLGFNVLIDQSIIANHASCLIWGTLLISFCNNFQIYNANWTLFSIINGTVSVDTFFTISAILFCK
jgi:hypothetical protein